MTFILLFPPGGPVLPGRPICLSVSHQAHVNTPLPEVHIPRYHGLDIPGPVEKQRLGKYDVGKDGGCSKFQISSRTPPLCFQDKREWVPHFFFGRGITDLLISREPEPMILSYSIVHNPRSPPIPVQPIDMVWEVFIDTSKQQLHPGQVKVWQVHTVLLRKCAGL